MKLEAPQLSLLQEIEELKKENAALKTDNERLQQQNETLLSDLADAANELQISIEQFKLMADNIPVMVWTANADGSVDYFNKQWYDYTGQSENMPHGWGWQPILHPDDLQRTLNTWNNSLLTGQTYEIEYRFKKADDGTYRWQLGKALPLRDKDGKVLKWFGTCTDIHEQKEAETKKDEFISIASHELKTPLTTVKAFVQLAKSISLPESPAFSFMGKASLQLDRLEKLVSNLLDVSRINAGRMLYNLEEFDFAAALQETVDSVQQISPEHCLLLEVPPGAISFTGDKMRLEQVINNLLVNAIKYSPGAGKVVVRCEVQKNNIVVSVQDFGVGIAPENLKNLFDRYYRADNTATRFQGLGLGLFISSEIVKRHKGSFWIESEEGKGSTFYFLLPIDGKSQLTLYETDHRTFYKSHFLTLQYDAGHHWLEADWLGFQNYDTVKQGCLIMLDLLKKNSCQQVLNDNTHVAGNWSEASDWVSEYWFPAMREAGLQQFAWIHSPSTFGRMAASKSLEPRDNSFTRFFNNMEDASAWLLSMKESPVSQVNEC